MKEMSWEMKVHTKLGLLVLSELLFFVLILLCCIITIPLIYEVYFITVLLYGYQSLFCPVLS